MQKIYNNKISSVLSFFPNVRGVGYSYFQSNKEHSISEMITSRKRFDNKSYMKRIKKLIDDYQPNVIVLEEYRKSKGSIKTERIRDLIKRISNYAKKNHIEVYFYTRHNIRFVFSNYNVMTKFDIANLICTWIPHLKLQMYVKREVGYMEPYSSAVFESVSLAITYFYLNY